MTDTTPTNSTSMHAPQLFANEQAPTTGDTLEDAARDEKDYVRQRLRDELGREPTGEEIDEWLREHTEGY